MAAATLVAQIKSVLMTAAVIQDLFSLLTAIPVMMRMNVADITIIVENMVDVRTYLEHMNVFVIPDTKENTVRKTLTSALVRTIVTKIVLIIWEVTSVSVLWGNTFLTTATTASRWICVRRRHVRMEVLV